MSVELKELGRYQIERVIGRGAMGVVYLARDPVIGRSVALKTLTSPAEDEEAEEFRQRFLREAQAAGILNHPGIVGVHDAGVDEESAVSYMALEYVQGQSLKELVRSGRSFAFSEIAGIGAALANALDYAHSRGVVHRDIKPANILATDSGAVKITDFGVARLESSNLTATGQFIGTPNYMSPEQVTGGRLDGRSDLFSLGVVLFELVAGRRPFVGGSLTEVAYKIVHEAPPIPSQLRPGVPPAFNPILLKLLDKDPARRYQRGEEVARALEALRRVLAGSGASAPVAVAPTEAEDEPPVRQSMTSAPTALRLPTAETADPPAPPTDVWHRHVEPRWAAVCVAALALPVAGTIAILAGRVDHGPFPGPAPGEPARRHAVVQAQQGAAAALAAGELDTAERLLRVVWDQAPYSAIARRLRTDIDQARRNERDAESRLSEAAGLREEGKVAYRAGRFREAAQDLARAVQLDPEDEVAKEYLTLAREQGRHVPTGTSRPAAGGVSAAAPPATIGGQARLELYFNSPIGAGTIEVLLGDTLLARKTFDARQSRLFGLLRKDRPTVVEDALVVPAGSATVVARLLDADGHLLGQERLPADFLPHRRYQLKIEMAAAAEVPRFSLNPWGR